MNVLAIGGEPGVGKSTAVQRVIVELLARGYDREDGSYTITHKGRRVTVHGVEFVGERPYYREHVIILGKYADGDTFPGTDRESMGVAPAAEALLQALAAKESETASVFVLFEGDRLFTRSFLLACARVATVRVCVLKATPEQLETRRKGRGSDQDSSWLKGRASKVAGIERWLEEGAERVERLNNGNPEEIDNLAATLIELLDLAP